MGENEILHVLSLKPNNWFSVKDIALMTSIGSQSVSISLKSMRQYDLVDWDKTNTLKGVPYYIYKFKKQKVKL
jgi:predicted transcriptional regulator